MKYIKRWFVLLGLLSSACLPVAKPAASAPVAMSPPTSISPTSASPSPTATAQIAYPYPVAPVATPLPYPVPTDFLVTLPLPPGPRPSEFITATLKTLPDTGQGIKAYDFLNEQVGWVATGLGWTEHTPSALLSTRDGGKTWKLLVNEVGEVTRRLSFVSPQLGWRIFSWGKVQITQDGGLSWSPFSLGAEEDCAIDLHFVDAQNGWVITCSYDLLRTQDGGKTWTLLPEPPAPAPGGWQAVNFLNRNHGWAAFTDHATDSSRFLILTETFDGGQTWQIVYNSEKQTPESAMLPLGIHGLTFSDALRGWLASGGDIYATQDGGATWQIVKSGATNPLYNILQVNRHLGFAVVDAGGPGRDALMKTSDGGRSWAQIYPPLFPLGELQFFDAQQGIGIGTAYDLGAILKTTDGGRTWKLFSSIGTTIETVYHLSFADPQHGWVMAQDCPGQADCGKTALYRTTDSGQTWERFPADGLSFIDLVTPSIGYTFKDGLWFITRDAGKTVEHIIGMAGITQVSFADPQYGWGLARSNILATADGGYNWRPIPLGAIPYQISYLPGGIGWVTTQLCAPPPACPKTLLQTQDDGLTWKAIYLPTLFIAGMRISTAQDGWLRGGEHAGMKGGYILGVDHLYVTHDGGFTWEQVK